MSYILDALKHSDRQKNRGAIPTLQTQAVTVAQTTEYRRVTPLFWSLGVLGVIVLGFILLYPSQNFTVVAPTSQVTSQPISQPSQPEAVKEPASSLTIPLTLEAKDPPLRKDEWLLPAESLAGLEGVKLSLNDPDAQPVAKPQRLEKIKPAGPSALAAYTKPENAGPAKAAAIPPVRAPEPIVPESDPYVGIPHIKQLDPSLQRQIPEMVFSVHIYNDQPGARLVKVNGSRYREGAQISSDLKLVEITRDGAIFNFKSTRFWRGAR